MKFFKCIFDNCFHLQRASGRNEVKRANKEYFNENQRQVEGISANRMLFPSNEYSAFFCFIFCSFFWRDCMYRNFIYNTCTCKCFTAEQPPGACVVITQPTQSILAVSVPTAVMARAGLGVPFRFSLPLLYWGKSVPAPTLARSHVGESCHITKLRFPPPPVLPRAFRDSETPHGRENPKGGGSTTRTRVSRHLPAFFGGAVPDQKFCKTPTRQHRRNVFL